MRRVHSRYERPAKTTMTDNPSVSPSQLCLLTRLRAALRSHPKGRVHVQNALDPLFPEMPVFLHEAIILIFGRFKRYQAQFIVEDIPLLQHDQTHYEYDPIVCAIPKSEPGISWLFEVTKNEDLYETERRYKVPYDVSA